MHTMHRVSIGYILLASSYYALYIYIILLLLLVRARSRSMHTTHTSYYPDYLLIIGSHLLSFFTQLSG